MDEQGQPRSLRRKIIRNTMLIFIGFIFVVLCFIFLGVAENSHQNATRTDCDHCDRDNNARVFRLFAAICFIFGFTVMTTFWWHLRAIKSAYVQRQRLVELQRLLGNREQPVRRLRNRLSLGKRNIG